MNGRWIVAFVVVLGCASAPKPAGEPVKLPLDPFAGCEVIRGEFVRRYACEKGAASVSLRGAARESPEVWLELQKANIQGAERNERVEVVVDGVAYPALRVSTVVEQDGESRDLDGYLLAMKSSAGLVTADCVVEGRETDLDAFCSPLWSTLLAVGPTLGAEAGPVLLGRELTVPAGCSVEANEDVSMGNIECAPDAVLSWAIVSSELGPDGVVDEFVHRFRTALARDGVRVEKWQPCTVAGEPGACRHLTLSVEETTVHVFSGARAEGEKILLVQCNTTRAVPDHPGCNGLVARAE